MLHIKNFIAKSPMVNKELAKILPIALSNQQQCRALSDHQIPERLQHIPTAQNPKFFDMVSSSFGDEKSFLSIFRPSRSNISSTEDVKSWRTRSSRTWRRRHRSMRSDRRWRESCDWCSPATTSSRSTSLCAATTASTKSSLVTEPSTQPTEHQRKEVSRAIA